MTIPSHFTFKDRKEKLKMTIVGIILVVIFSLALMLTFVLPMVDATDMILEEFNTEEPEVDKDIEIKEILGLHPGPCIPDEWFGPIVDVPIPCDTPPEHVTDEENIGKIYHLMYLDCPLSRELQDYIRELYWGLDFDIWYNSPEEFLALIAAIIQWESGFNANNSNGKNHGLMSVATLSDETMNVWGIKDLMDPFDNVTAGARCLRNILRDWVSGKPDAMHSSFVDRCFGYPLLAYNLGRKGASKYLESHNLEDFEYFNNVYGSYTKNIQELLSKMEETKNG